MASNQSVQDVNVNITSARSCICLLAIKYEWIRTCSHWMPQNSKSGTNAATVYCQPHLIRTEMKWFSTQNNEYVYKALIIMKKIEFFVLVILLQWSYVIKLRGAHIEQCACMWIKNRGNYKLGSSAKYAYSWYDCGSCGEPFQMENSKSPTQLEKSWKLEMRDKFSLRILLNSLKIFDRKWHEVT